MVEEKKNLKKTFSYDINIFNNEILKIIRSTLKIENFYNFEALFLRNIKNGMESTPSKEYIAKFKEILRKILKSPAARNYFNVYYKSQNKEKKVMLNYHFDRDEVIDEIFKRIKFSIIFKEGDQAYTSPFELKIFINSVPGQYDYSGIRLFERKILQFSRLITISVHEIMGHFLRRYYYYLTNNLVKLGTKEYSTFNTGSEGGKFVEQNFLGLSDPSLSLLDSLGYFKEKFDNFPILFKDKIDKKELEAIIKSNYEFFDFISLENKKEINKITVNEMYLYLLKDFNPQPRISCGNRIENVIFLENPHFFH